MTSVHVACTSAAIVGCLHLLLRLNRPGSPFSALTACLPRALQVNTLSAAMMQQFEPVLSQLETDGAIRGAVVLSGKSDNFIAGADITMLDACTSAEQLTDLSRQGQVLMDRLAKLNKPVVAAINGSCLGGGLELALACKYRIASSSPKTRLGVPEVQLGLLPGAGGTQRLPRTVGIQQALTLMTTGQQVKPDKARKIGLVHEVVDPSAIQEVAVTAARELVAGTLKVPHRKAGLMEKLLEGNPLGRMVLFDQAGKKIAKAAGGHYPSPPAILECVREGVEKGHTAGSAKEAQYFGKLGMTTASQALRGIFFAQTATKKNPFGKPSGGDVKTIGVLGAGLMGAGIAQVSANAGLRVVLKDKDRKGLARGEKQVADSLAARVKKRSMSAFDRDATLSRIIGVTDEDASWTKHMGRADIVLEAVFEDLGLKHRVIKDVEPHMHPRAVFATNTSAIPIGSIATAATRPERVVGMHYFSPVDKMPLLEVIPHAGTAPDAAAVAVEAGYKQGKTVIVVKDVPGFYVNRCLGPFMSEGFALVQSGVAPETLDRALKSFGMPVGPITLADEVGVDVAYHTAKTLSGALGDRMAGSNQAAIKEMVDKKLLGRKTGKGFYLYDSGAGGSGGKGGKGKGKETKTVNPDALEIMARYRSGTGGESLDAKTLQERMLLRFVKECILCLQDGVIRSAGDGDIGAVFGIGFPPFLGGPFRYVDLMGAAAVADSMKRYADTVGPYFAPPQLLLDLAAKNGKFHSSK